MSYTINPNAKNKWARNAENTMDLSLETDASSVYLDNGRTLEQEIGEGSMVSNVTIVDSAMSKIIDGTLDGAYESGVMYGRSLVNLCRDSWWNGTLTNSYDIVQQLKPNTKYIILVNSVENIENISLATSKYSPIVYGECEDNTFKFITPSNTAELVKVRILLSESPSSEPFYEALLLEYQEGMENWDIPYFTGLCDVKMPILQNTGENLFDPNSPLPDDLNYFYNSDNKNQLTTHTQMLSCAIPVIKGKTYSFYFNQDEIPLKVHKSGVFPTFVSGGVGGNGYPHSVRTITAPMDGYFGIMFCYTEDGTTDNWTKVARDWKKQLKLTIVEGKSINTYIPYKTNILRTPEIVTLRSLPNGVRDELNLKTGEYTKRIEEIVLNGTENNWITIFDFNGTKDYSTFKLDVPLLGAKKATYPINSYVVDKLGNETGLSIAKEFVHINNQPMVCIKLLRTKLSEQTVAGLKAWLQQNPITIQYELAEPITTIVEPLTTPFAYQNGHIILESGYEGQSLLPTLEYSTVVNKTGQIESVAKTIQRQEKQLTMLEKMLIQNIINLDYNNTLLTLKNEMEEML